MDAPTMPLAGILNIDKPYGITSMELVRRVKRATGIKRVGHGGTLDPVATGVVPVCLGQATRMMEYLVDGTKEYSAEIELGVDTDTYDALGQTTRVRDPSGVTLSDIGLALESFKGSIQQVPPMYSALKRQGKRLYDLARAGVEVDRQPRPVEVFRIQLLDWSPPAITLDVTCGRGFYMRSLAHDIGQLLGCGAHLKALRRTRSGAFKISDALTLTDAEEKLRDGSWADAVYPPDVVLYGLKAVVLGKANEETIRHGQPLPAIPPIPTSHPGEQCRAYAIDGRFLAVLAFDAPTGRWRPDKVFSLGAIDDED